MATQDLDRSRREDPIRPAAVRDDLPGVRQLRQARFEILDGDRAGAAALLGVGMAMVYPTLIAAVGDVAHLAWRTSALGVYRLWRDVGFAVGALVAGVIADALGFEAAIGVVAALALAAGSARRRPVRRSRRCNARPGHSALAASVHPRQRSVAAHLAVRGDEER